MPKHWFNRPSDVGQVHFGIIDARGSNLAEVLHQQEVNLVANRIRFGSLRQKMLDQAQQAFLGYQGIGLQELAQLVHLNLAVHLLQPLPGLLHGLFAGSFDAGLKLGAGLHVNRELARAYPGRRLRNSHLCTVDLAQRLMPQVVNHKLDSLAAYFGFEIARRHRAPDDALAAARIFLRLLDELSIHGISTLAEARHFQRIVEVDELQLAFDV